MKYIIILVLCLVSSCANYTFGDPSIKFCTAATPELKAAAKAILLSNGIVVGSNYCEAVLLADLIIDKE